MITKNDVYAWYYANVNHLSNESRQAHMNLLKGLPQRTHKASSLSYEVNRLSSLRIYLEARAVRASYGPRTVVRSVVQEVPSYRLWAVAMVERDISEAFAKVRKTETIPALLFNQAFKLRKVRFGNVL